MKNDTVDFNNLNDSQKINYVKNLFFNSEINDALDTLLKNEKKDLKVITIILSVLDEELIINRIKQQCNLSNDNVAKVFVYSKILSILSFYNKTVILNKFLKSLTEEERKEIAIYEYQNKTSVSIDNKIFNKYCLKYKNQALEDLKQSDEETLMLTMEMQRYDMLSDKKKRKKRKLPLWIPALLVILLVSIFGYRLYSYSKLISGYEGSFYPGIYLNDMDLANVQTDDLKDIIEEEKKKIQNGYITITNVNGEYKTTYLELGILIDADKIQNEIEVYNNGLSFFEKVKLIKSNKRNKTFYLSGTFNDDAIEDFMKRLEGELNVSPIDDGIVVDENHNVRYDKGSSGFTLDVKKTKAKIKESLLTLGENTKVEAVGSVIKNEIKYESLSVINKKISSYTTYFVNAGNRGHNINLASSRLNNTILMPGEEFSYLKTVGPYGAANGYLPAPIYLNGTSATANGGGVCQLASTLYNAQLRAGLITTSRRGHTFAPTYVPKGLDATVYSTTTDYKFKNNYEYPFYIVSYVKGNYLTVDIWSNESALDGKTYEPYSVYSNGGYLAYLKTIKDGKIIETKYLDKSYYKAH